MAPTHTYTSLSSHCTSSQIIQHERRLCLSPPLRIPLSTSPPSTLSALALPLLTCGSSLCAFPALPASRFLSTPVRDLSILSHLLGQLPGRGRRRWEDVLSGLLPRLAGDAGRSPGRGGHRGADGVGRAGRRLWLARVRHAHVSAQGRDGAVDAAAEATARAAAVDRAVVGERGLAAQHLAAQVTRELRPEQP